MWTVSAAISAIAMMGIFALKNNKNGWLKPRTPMIENLLEADWKLYYGLSPVPEVSGAASTCSAGMARILPSSAGN
jgi:hypothetical protein